MIELAYGGVEGAFFGGCLDAEFHDHERLDPVRRHTFQTNLIMRDVGWDERGIIDGTPGDRRRARP